MKSLKNIVKTALLFFLLCMSIYGSTDKLMIVTSDDSAPFYFENTDGESDGIIIDIWKLWSKKTRIKVEFVETSWSDSLYKMKSGQTDVHVGLYKTKDRQKYLDYGNELIESRTNFFYHKDILISQ